MANKAPIPLDQPGLPISKMPIDSDISGNEYIPSVEGGINSRMQLDAIKKYMVGDTMTEREAIGLVDEVFFRHPE